MPTKRRHFFWSMDAINHSVVAVCETPKWNSMHRNHWPAIKIELTRCMAVAAVTTVATQWWKSSAHKTSIKNFARSHLLWRYERHDSCTTKKMITKNVGRWEGAMCHIPSIHELHMWRSCGCYLSYKKSATTTTCAALFFVGRFTPGNTRQRRG